MNRMNRAPKTPAVSGVTGEADKVDAQIMLRCAELGRYPHFMRPAQRVNHLASESVWQWTKENDKTLAEAVEAIREDVANGTGFEGSLEHYAALFEITEDCLRHEWNLRTGERTHPSDKHAAGR